MLIRPAQEADLTAIVEIYNQSIPGGMATADTQPVTMAERQDWFYLRSPNRPIWVAETSGTISGWLSFQNFYGRPAYLQTAEVSIYVATAQQRQGLGTSLLKQAIARAPELNITTLLGFVFAHNYPSLELLIKHGFQEWGHLPDVARFETVTRSLIIMGRKLNSDSP